MAQRTAGRLVVIDDDPDLLLLATTWFRRMLNVDAQPVLPGAYKSIDWSKVDMAIIDLMMTPIGGEEVLEFLKENYPDVRRVVWSAAPGMMAKLPPGLAHSTVDKLGMDDLMVEARKALGL
jgi:DNA-binding NtrC family response regulator